MLIINDSVSVDSMSIKILKCLLNRAQDSVLLNDEWSLTDIRTMDGTVITAEDINYLMENQSAVKQVIE